VTDDALAAYLVARGKFVGVGASAFRSAPIFVAAPNGIIPPTAPQPAPSSPPIVIAPVPVAAAPAPFHPLLFLFRDDKAFRVGDLVTVLVTQTAVASSASQTATSKQIQIQTQAGTGLFSFIPMRACAIKAVSRRRRRNAKT
jgi:flagellar basal body L-ring protein FlgH